MIHHLYLLNLTFDQVPAGDETVGIGRFKGIRYRHHTFVALDEDNLPREYDVTVSSRCVVKIRRRWLTADGKAQQQLRAEAEVPARAREFVAAFFKDHPCNPYNGIELARFLCGMDSKFEGLFNWQQHADFIAHGFTGKTNGEAQDFIRGLYLQSETLTAA